MTAMLSSYTSLQQETEMLGRPVADSKRGLTTTSAVCRSSSMTAENN